MFILVRHADAGDKHRWDGADVRRPLSRKGLAQASAVGALVGAYGAERLWSSPALRCVQTLVPSAKVVGLPVQTRRELGIGAAVEDVLRLLDRADVDGAVLCTHGETLTGLSEAWTSAGRVAIASDRGVPGLARTPKGALWVVDDYHGARPRAHFVPPAEGPGE